MIAVLFGLSSALVCARAQQAEQRVYRIAIDRGDLDEALKQLAHQTGIQIARYSSAESSNVVIGPLREDCTLDQALSRLLSGTGLVYRFVNERMVSIYYATDPAAQRESPVIKRTDDSEDAGTAGQIQAAPDNSPPTKASLWARLAMSVGVCAATAGAGSVCAQEATTNDVQGLQEVTVTANRREEDQQKVPVTVATISGDELAAFGPVNIEGLAQSVSGLNIGSSAGGPTVYLRGVGYASTQIGTDSPVGIYIDGVYQSFAQAGIFQLNNIERVEVLYGPQGTLFGRNTSGGVIQLVTKDPSATPHLDAAIGYGNYNTVTSSVYGTTGLGNGLAGDLSFVSNDQKDGWGTNLSLDRPLMRSWDYSLRSKLKWTNDSGTTVSLTGNYYTWDNDSVFHFISPGQTARGNYTSAGYFDAYPNTNGTLDTAPDHAGKKLDGTLRASQEFSAFSIVDILAYQNAKTSNEIPYSDPVNYSTQDQHISDGVWSNELQFLSSKGSRFTWVGGLYLYEDAGFSNIVLYGTQYASQGGGVRTVADLDTHSYAGYGQAEIQLTDATQLTLGARETRDTRTVWATVTPYLGAVTSPAAHDQWDKFTYRIALDQQFTPNVLGYVSYNTGFKSGGFSITNPATAAVDPENVKAYEAGVKTELFDKRIRFNTSAFYYDYTGLQLRGADPVTRVQTLLNAKAARVYGVDLEFDAQIAHGLSFNSTIEYLNATYSDFKNAQIVIPGTQGFFNGVSTTGDVTGNELQNAPRFSSNLGFNYDVALGSGDLSILASAKYTDTYAWTTDNLVWEPVHWMVNSAIKWSTAGDRYDVTLYTDNLLNVKWSVNTGEGVPNGSYTPGAPRTYGIRAGAHF